MNIGTHVYMWHWDELLPSVHVCQLCIVSPCWYRHQVLYPLMAIDQLGKWDVDAKVQGGGSTGSHTHS